MKFGSFSLLIVITALFSCADHASEALTNDIVGTWQLTETLADPGDGSGTWQKADDLKFLTFRYDGTLSDTVNPEITQYHIIQKDSAIQFISKNNSYNVRYKINDAELLITPQCFEACGSKYKKIVLIG